jgi:ATP-dependent RNA helicase HelY
MVAALAASREFLLRSAFAPTYNMVVNLIGRHGREQAHELMGRSFAQYQADRHLAGVEHRRGRQAAALAEAEAAATCERGSVDEYRELRAAARRRAREARAATKAAREEAIAALAPGDVLAIGRTLAVVLSASHRKGGLRLRLVDASSGVTVLDGDSFDEAPAVVHRLALPEPYDPGSRAYQHQVAALGRKAARAVDTGARSGPPGRGPRQTERPPAGEAEAADHPVAACPDLESHLAAAAERDRLRGRIGQLDALIEDRSTSLTRRFDRIAELLTGRGFLHDGVPTRRGRVLARIFHESDLLVATALCDGVLDDLEPASLAALVSMFTYEHRSKDRPPPPWFPSPAVRERAARIERLGAELARDESRARIPATRLPDPTFVAAAYAWASGESLDVVLGAEEQSGGDFIRNVKQIIDLLRQLGDVAPQRSTATSARQAAEALHRGIVAASGEVSEAEAEPGAEEPGP